MRVRSQLPIRGVHSDRGVWYVRISKDEIVPFADGLTLKPNGDGNYHVDMSTAGDDPKKTQKLRKKVKKYAADFIQALRSGEVGPPSAGDCMYCVLRTEEGIPAGESFKDKDHILSHISEGYFVPSLLVRATEVMPCSQVMKWAIGDMWQKEKTQSQEVFEKISGDQIPGFVWKELEKMVAKYVLRQLGEVS